MFGEKICVDALRKEMCNLLLLVMVLAEHASNLVCSCVCR